MKNIKSIKSKIPAIIGTVINILALISYIVMLILFSLDIPFMNQGIGLFWMALTLICVMIGNLLYLADAVLSLIKSFMGIDRIFNAMLSVLVIASIISLWLGTAYAPLIVVWLVFCVVIFVLEIISIVKHIKREINFPK